MNESFEMKEPKYLEVFHAAQAKLLEGDFEAGREFLAQAATLVEDLDDRDFLEYIKGTQAYLEQDRESLKLAIGQIQEPHNKALLERFLFTLESGEQVDYNRDYMG
ncbi:hypothetical protein C0580_03730 [Candidatus Parcubacteria bacterium]|nr:MAG: hypothetical protein C0580_03730 [Candidatus Parcubacteria bacterium]